MRYCKVNASALYMAACLFVCGWVQTGARAADAGTAARIAQEVVNQATVPAGLCVHIGCGSDELPALTADLAASGAFLVHGLALDDNALARVRQAIGDKKMEGRALVERIELKQLPYLSDMVNLLVVESPGELIKLGIAEAELLRVVTPNGVLCRREAGKWVVTVKPMPAGFDEWSHIEHDAAGNNVSFDKRIAPPFGVRWLDGVKMYYSYGYLGNYGWIIANGRCFTLGASVEENAGKRPEDFRVYLLARDAFNGLPLWRINCGYMLPGDNRFNKNVPPLASDGVRVYAPLSNQVMAVDAASGKIVTRFATAYPAGHLVITDHVLVVAGWQDTQMKGDKWLPRVNVGSVEGFDAESGQRLWSVPGAADKLVAAGGLAYLNLLGTTNRPNCALVAVELKSGKELWRKPASADAADDWFVNCAGAGFVIAFERQSKMLRSLDARDGHVIWEMSVPSRFNAPPAVGLFGNDLWCGSAILDVKTGKKTGTVPAGMALGILNGACADTRYIDRRMVASGKGAYAVLGANGKTESMTYSGVRRACGPGDAIAYGTMYISQGRCMGCARGQVLGFRGIGSLEWPTQQEMEAARPVEQGPAFGQGAEVTVASDAWPQSHHDAERSAWTSGALPERLTELWQQPVPGAGEPVSAHGLVFVSQPELGGVRALHAATGKETWRATFGSRVQTPAIWRGLCLVACSDGWLYALSIKDGRLAWRTRCAPREQRMVAFGRVESSWPIEGSPMVDGDVVVVSAGRTSQSDGGVTVLAIEAATGKTIWARQLCNLNNQIAFRNTWLMKTGDSALLNQSHLALKDGSTVTNAPVDMWYQIGDWGRGSQLAWTPTQVLTGAGLFPRPAGTNSWDACRKMAVWKRSEALVPSAWSVSSMVAAANATVFAGAVPGKQGTRGFIHLGAVHTGVKLAAVTVDAPVNSVAVASRRLYATTANGKVICYGAE